MAFEEVCINILVNAHWLNVMFPVMNFHLVISLTSSLQSFFVLYFQSFVIFNMIPIMCINLWAKQMEVSMEV